MTNGTNGKDWGEYKRLILKELDDLNGKYGDLDTKMDTVITEIAMLKFKSGLWGATAGMIPVAVFLLIKYIGD